MLAGVSLASASLSSGGGETFASAALLAEGNIGALASRASAAGETLVYQADHIQMSVSFTNVQVSGVTQLTATVL